MSDFIGIEVTGLEPMIQGFNRLPDVAQDRAIENVSIVLMESIKQYPQYKHITRKQAYPPTGWQSEKQRRYVMASITDGSIKVPYSRTMGLASAWHTVGKGKSMKIVNSNPAVVYAHSDTQQSRLLGMIGWEKITAFLQKRNALIQKAAEAGVNQAISEVGLSGGGGVSGFFGTIGYKIGAFFRGLFR